MQNTFTRGLINLPSLHSFSETVERLENLVASKGMSVLARINHSGDAARAGIIMNQTFLLIFGNAKVGTPLMIAAPSVAVDLPLKALVWQDADGEVWISYNTPEYLGERHSIPQTLVSSIAGIHALCQEAAKA